MLYSGSERVTLSLSVVAQTFVQLGYSVIPVFGDLDLSQPKVAAVDWKAYQYRRARPDELDYWFNKRGFGGLAVVTGRISNLIVLDFDNEALAQLFEREYPDLVKTRVVRSAQRNLPHYYYRVPPNVVVSSRRLKGVDLQSDGRYVLAPPTTIQGKAYQIVQGGSPLEINRAQLEHIQAFLDRVAQLEQLAKEPFQPTTKPTAPPTIAPYALRLVPQQAVVLYKQYAPVLGRNEALFKVSLQMRDLGYSESDVLRLLADVHAHNLLPRESLTPRYKEAFATIHSAFSRPPRKVTTSANGLPTSVREKLLQLNLTCVLRVLDGLLLKGVPFGALMTEKGIRDTLQESVGRYSILNALKATFGDGSPIFDVDPFPSPHTPTNVASNYSLTENKKCLLLGMAKSDKNRGRPSKQFRLPDVAYLCAKLGVKFTTSDPLVADDLKTVASYRRALHRELIKRRPATYSGYLLARRLNVCKRTCQRYTRDAQIQTRPMYDVTPIHVSNFGRADVPQKGEFIQDMNGKRYPATRQIAQRLFAQGKVPMLLKQVYNTYWHPDGKPAPVITKEDTVESIKKAPDSVFYDDKVKWYTQEVKTPEKTVLSENKPPMRPRLSPLKVRVAQYQAKAKRYYRRALAETNLEVMANRLYETIRDLNSHAVQHRQTRVSFISLALARRLAEEFGGFMLKRVIQVIQARKNIANYAGFVRAWLQSERTMQRLQAMA